MQTLLDCGKHFSLAVKRHFSTVLSTRVLITFPIGRVKRGDANAREAIFGRNIIDCVRRSTLGSNNSSKVFFLHVYETV